MEIGLLDISWYGLDRTLGWGEDIRRHGTHYDTSGLGSNRSRYFLRGGVTGFEQVRNRLRRRSSPVSSLLPVNHSIEQVAGESRSVTPSQHRSHRQFLKWLHRSNLSLSLRLIL